MRRALLIIAFMLGLPVLLLGALLTPWGLGVALGFVPGLQLEGLSGPLPGRLGAERVSLTDPEGTWLEAEGVEIQLAWRDLLAGRVRLEAVGARRLILHRLPPSAPTAEPAPFALPRLPHLPVAIRLEGVDLPRVELGEAVLGQAASLSLVGSLALEAAHLAASLTLQRLDRPGSARLELSLGGVALTANLAAAEPAGGLVAALAGMPEAPFALDLSLDGPASGAAWSLAATLGPAEAHLRGNAGLAADGTLALTLGGTASPAGLLPAAFAPLAARITLDAAVARAPDGALTLGNLALGLPAGQASGAGRLDAREALSARFRLDAAPAEFFAPWLPPGLTWRALSAEGEVSGSLAAPALILNILAEAPHGLGEADAMLGEAPRLHARLAGGHIEASLAGERVDARLDGPITAPFDLAFTLSARDPPGLTGDISAEGRLAGTAEAPLLQAELRSERLEGQGQVFEAIHLSASASVSAARVEGVGRFQSRPLNLNIEASREGEILRLDRLEARFAEATLTGSGRGSLPAGPFTGDVRLEAPDLARLELGLHGRLSAELNASAIPGASGAAAQGIRLRLNGTGLGTTGLRAGIQAEAEGSLAALAFRLGLTVAEGALNLAGELALDGTEAQITLVRLEARSGLDALNLAGPARIRVNQAGDGVLEPARLTSRRGGTLALQGRVQGGQITARADLAAVPLGPLSGGLATGTASGQATASGSLGTPQIEASLRVDALRASQAPLLPPAQLTGTARLQGQALRAEARLTAGPAVQLDITAQQPRGLGPAQAFEASLRGRLDLGLLARPYLAAGADRVSGRLALDLRASGTPAAPVLAGGATLSEASYANPIYGTRIEGVGARLTAQGQRLVVESFTGRTGGGGTLSAQGWIEPLGEGLPAQFRLQAEAARPIGGSLGDATLDADLRLAGPLLSGGSLSGRVNLRRAELRIPESLPASVPSLAPVRQIGPLPPGRPAPPAPRPPIARPSLPMALDITVAAPRALFIRGRGLDAELGGELVLRGTLAAPIPSGGFRLRRGSYDLAGRRLEFSRGIIGFDSQNFTPNLDFLASARSRSHTINLTITGNPATPQIHVTAEPELPQDEALARLLFDRETGRLSPFEILTITQAAAQLAGLPTPGLSAMDRLRRGLGLDRLGVGSDGSGRAALEAGGYVAPGVYLGIRQGTAGGAPGVGVQVELTPSLRMEGQTSTGPAGDRLGITWEREY
ncbi:translocation/assembly module TamB domain-containing protein [Sediminicoccus sp. KRV36]|uniref:translocation/assembly module TamB domain-containing protein n=1 Tax=Sediminicoccus sp. KRV36 TaxID=3133721 RepID=UPI00200F7202|nr:translocation/assembly module TamB domain-containing protein [Sediminicoccus rosea]UPY35733.1 translocation/assembly module TamB domain-containing protein [Sediminicoccus rosea]